MSAQTDISIAFVKHLKTLPGLPSLVAWENGRTKEPVNGQLFYSEAFLPADVSAVTLGNSDQNEYRGLYQVSIFVPANAGRVAAMIQADGIADHFKKGTEFSHDTLTVRIDRPASVTPLGEEDAWYQCAVRIPYQVFV